jgi:protein-L-isoaspartate O-methyltransferase
MKRDRRILLAMWFVLAAVAVVRADERPSETAYVRMAQRTRDGIGVSYFGREIAQVMGHEGAGWLERAGREAEERTDLLLQSLELKPGEQVADVGAGSGYFSWRMAKQVGVTGKVFAVEIQQQMLDLLMANMARRGVAARVEPVLGSVSDPKLPANAVDVILLVDVYHEFDHPYEMTRAMIAALRPGGRLVIVEYRGEDPEVHIKPLHKMTVAQMQREFAPHPVILERVDGRLPQQHIFVFRRR